ncbi:MAG: FAD-binding oxidoreductase [Roseiflexus sp.]|jgi:glycolate oxidase FAD binding subunit|nr:FAD-binding oxidoreductase [Roseiflexus sp.]MBO9334858.1 FAD-binding oxidoreductase [Roseiflexus sp.]MBO9366790.1 FAD-binding oxidoreductase [Roseiflexus sp.]MBO9382781.1 FAD-binding oxidoreductase [Roseiflexus sp.]MBO9389373.1 FAD-binding oxidoreductase [Roseiflexus sp.]
MNLIETLRTALPPDTVQDDAPTLEAFSVQGVRPLCVVTPGNVEELQVTLRIAAERRAALAAWGGGTQQLIGAPPTRLDLVVRTTQLNRVLAHTPDDLTISVEAGMTFGALRTYLAQHRQMLALDPPLPDRATIGGLIATATDGPRRLGYGTLRDVLIGIAVVEVGGRLSRGGGMVVKNVSGFDMMKLYLGSFGTLAVIASANFKLLPQPRATGTILCRFNDPKPAFAALDELDGTQLAPVAAEYLNRSALAAMGQSGVCALALAAEGLPQAVERQINDMSAIMRRHGAPSIERLDSSEAEALWSAIADLPQTATLAADEAVVKLSVLPADVASAIAQCEASAARVGSSVAINARALNGVMYARVRPVTAAALTTLTAELPGLQWVATKLPDTPRWGAPPQGLDVMRRIREEFDPLRLLNPGRFLPGV